jgi:hypothetical protein
MLVPQQIRHEKSYQTCDEPTRRAGDLGLVEGSPVLDTLVEWRWGLLTATKLLCGGVRRAVGWVATDWATWTRMAPGQELFLTSTATRRATKMRFWSFSDLFGQSFLTYSVRLLHFFHKSHFGCSNELSNDVIKTNSEPYEVFYRKVPGSLFLA